MLSTTHFCFTLVLKIASERGSSASHVSALAVDGDTIEGPEEERTIEIGFVGRTNSNMYVTRRRVLSMLDRHFQMNDWRRRYSSEEMAAIYRLSKIMINIPREDYLQEANMRCSKSWDRALCC